MQMALVIDEYGGTDGLVSLEDVIEMVVGDIEDEHDDDEQPDDRPDGEGMFLADARADLDDVSAAVGADLSGGEDGEDVDTVGGLVFSLLGRDSGARRADRGARAASSSRSSTPIPRRIKRLRISAGQPAHRGPSRAAARVPRPSRAPRLDRCPARPQPLDRSGGATVRSGRCERIADRIIRLRGWRRLALAVVAGGALGPGARAVQPLPGLCG